MSDPATSAAPCGGADEGRRVMVTMSKITDAEARAIDRLGMLITGLSPLATAAEARQYVSEVDVAIHKYAARATAAEERERALRAVVNGWEGRLHAVTSMLTAREPDMRPDAVVALYSIRGEMQLAALDGSEES